jgi:hypothetical protein
MVDDAYPRWFDTQQVFHLAGGEGRDRDDQIGSLGGVASLGGEALPKLGSGIVARDYEQIVKGGDASGVAGGSEALIQPMEEGRRRCAIFPQHAARGHGRKALGE